VTPQIAAGKHLMAVSAINTHIIARDPSAAPCPQAIRKTPPLQSMLLINNARFLLSPS